VWRNYAGSQPSNRRESWEIWSRQQSAIAYEDLQISDAISIARTGQERCHDDENDEQDYEAILRLILYRLEQIQEGHELIVKNAPYPRYVPEENAYSKYIAGEEGGL
jgi:hypothetical protein